MVIKRELINQVKPFIGRKEYIGVVGPRQSGKTTFLKIVKGYLKSELGIGEKFIQIITFEDRRLLLQFEEDPVSFMKSWIVNQNKKFYLLIDEFQYAREGGQKLKLVYDTIPNLKVIITGSSSLEIATKVRSYMVGRLLIFKMHPFNFAEFLRSKDLRMERVYKEKNQKIYDWIKNSGFYKFKEREDIYYRELIKLYESYCIWGGYPSVVLTENEAERKKVLSDIFNSYILNDIKGLLDLSTERELFLLSRYLATQIGNIVVYSNLGSQSNLNYRNLKKHLGILMETFIIKELKPYYRNKQKELSKNPKIYFMDNGFRDFLIDSFNSLEDRPDRGPVVENAVFVRLNQSYEGSHNINFWRTKAGSEVDFVINTGNEIIPVEVKFSEFNRLRFSRSFVSFLKTFKPDCGLVLTKNYWGSSEVESTKVLFAPVYYL